MKKKILHWRHFVDVEGRMRAATDKQNCAAYGNCRMAVAYRSVSNRNVTQSN